MQICQNIFGLAVINSAFLINRLPTKVLSNQSTIQIIRNPSFYECTKHFELDCHIVREKLNSGLIHLLPISTKLQLADIFTKSLHPSPFSSIISKFGMVNIHSPTCSRGSENSSLSPAQFDPAKCSPDWSSRLKAATAFKWRVTTTLSLLTYEHVCKYVDQVVN